MISSSPARGFTLLLTLVLLVVVACFSTTLAAIYISQYRHEDLSQKKPRSAQIARAALSISLDRLSQATDGVDNDFDGAIDEGLDWNKGLLAPEALPVIEGYLGRIGTLDWTPACDCDRNMLADVGEVGVKPVQFGGGFMTAFTLFSQEDGIDSDADGTVDEQDEAGSVMVVAVGMYRGAVTTLECRACFGDPFVPANNPCWSPEHAILSGGNLRLAGSPVFRGQGASLHANGEMITCGACDVGGDATACAGLTLSASAAVAGRINGAAAPLPVPAVDPALPGRFADYRIFGSGAVFDSRGRALNDLSASSSFRGWSMTGKGFRFCGEGVDPASAAGTWWIDGDVHIAGTGKAGTVSSTGSDSTQTFTMTVLASGSIEIAGDTRLRHAHPDGFLLVAAGDLRLAGEPHADQILVGILASREQVRISGSPEITGFVVAQNACDLDRLNSENAIFGSPVFISEGGARTGLHLMDPAFPWFKLEARVVSVTER